MDEYNSTNDAFDESAKKNAEMARKSAEAINQARKRNSEVGSAAGAKGAKAGATVENAKAGAAAGEAAGATSGKAAADAGAKSAGAATGPVGIAIAAVTTVASSKTGRYLIIGLLLLCMLPAILISALPSVIWNKMFHVNSDVDPYQSLKIEQKLGKDDMIERETEYFDIITSGSEAQHEATVKAIENTCRVGNISFPLTEPNIIDSSDLFGQGDSSFDKKQVSIFNSESAAYENFNKKGYSDSANVSMLACAQYLSNMQVDASEPNIVRKRLVGYKFKEDSSEARTGYGIFLLDQEDYRSYVIKKIKSKNATKVKDAMDKPGNQCDYADVFLKAALGSKYATFKSAKDTPTAIKYIVKALSGLDNADKDSLKAQAQTIALKHNLNVATSSSTGTYTTYKRDANRPTEIDGLKKEILKEYKKSSKKKIVDSCYKKMLSMGVSKEAAAGAMGNAYQESKWDTKIMSTDGHDSVGLFQWAFGRIPAMKKAIGKNWDTDYVGQAEYAIKEAKTNIGLYPSRVSWYHGFCAQPAFKDYTSWATSHDLARTTMNWEYQWERCDPGSSYTRYAAAEVVLEQCGNLKGEDSNDTEVSEDTRDRVLILGAYSVYENQFFPEEDAISSLSGNETANKAVAFAKSVSNKGYKYRLGGGTLTKKAGGGIDCAHFVQYCYGEAGSKILNKKYKYPHVTAIANNLPKKYIYKAASDAAHGLKEKDMKPGDLLVFSDKRTNKYEHIAMYVGNGEICHASSPKTGVIKTKISYSADGAGRYVSRIIRPYDDKRTVKQKVNEKTLTTITDANVTSFQKVLTALFAKTFNGICDVLSQEEAKLRLEVLISEAKLYNVEYGDVAKNKEGEKYYTQVELKPLPLDEMIKEIFNMDPEETYKNGTGETTIREAVETMADSNNALLGDPTDSDDSTVCVGSGRFAKPLGGATYTLTSPFGWRIHPISGVRKYHDGLDMAAPAGTPIYAADDGKVELAGINGDYGNCVIINHGNGLQSLYGHMNQIKTVKGRKVKKGQLIGTVGSTGRSTGAHLHFEVRKKGVPVDPTPYLKKKK